MKRLFIETLGWYGALAIITAYCLVSFEVIQPTGIAFQLLNLTGAFGLIISTYVKKDWQVLALNVFWLGIAAFALAQIALS